MAGSARSPWWPTSWAPWSPATPPAWSRRADPQRRLRPFPAFAPDIDGAGTRKGRERGLLSGGIGRHRRGGAGSGRRRAVSRRILRHLLCRRLLGRGLLRRGVHRRRLGGRLLGGRPLSGRLLFRPHPL